MTLTLLGRKPVNPFGSCFDSAAWAIIEMGDYPDAVMCHGTGISNLPGEEGETIAHAWIEFSHPAHGRCALDPIWMLAQPIELYRKNLQADIVVEYKRKAFLQLWKRRGYPGPYDKRIRIFTKEGKMARDNGVKSIHN